MSGPPRPVRSLTSSLNRPAASGRKRSIESGFPDHGPLPGHQVVVLGHEVSVDVEQFEHRVDARHAELGGERGDNDRLARRKHQPVLVLLVRLLQHAIARRALGRGETLRQSGSSIAEISRLTESEMPPGERTHSLHRPSHASSGIPNRTVASPYPRPATSPWMRPSGRRSVRSGTVKGNVSR